jgi:hypothetical protein
MRHLESKAKKCHNYLYFDQLLVFLLHLEDRDTYSNLGTERNEDEEEANNLQEEVKEWPRIVRKKKQDEISYEEALLQNL